jgi:thymidylate kinase
MSVRTKFIVFDGMDNCGKSTLIADLVRDRWPVTKEIKFPKTLPSGALLRINTEKDFELLFSMFELLDKTKVYLLDRFVVSNLVYDKVLRGEETSLSMFYHEEFLRRFDVLEIFVTRPPIGTDFIDDRIKMTRDQFNAGIHEYKQYGPNFQILDRDEQDQPTTPTIDRDKVMMLCNSFINSA